MPAALQMWEVDRAAPRLAQLPEAQLLPVGVGSRLGGSAPTCTCNNCLKCAERLRRRLLRRGIRVGRWSSSRARFARDARLEGASWAEIARVFDYATAQSARNSVLRVCTTQNEREAARLGISLKALSDLRRARR